MLKGSESLTITPKSRACSADVGLNIGGILLANKGEEITVNISMSRGDLIQDGIIISSQN